MNEERQDVQNICPSSSDSPNESVSSEDEQTLNSSMNSCDEVSAFINDECIVVTSPKSEVGALPEEPISSADGIIEASVQPSDDILNASIDKDIEDVVSNDTAEKNTDSVSDDNAQYKQDEFPDVDSNKKNMVNESWESDVYENRQHLCFAVKVKGSSHIKGGTNCQDAFEVEKHESNGITYLITSVTDGHGSKKHYLSEFGSEIAARCSINILKEICSGSTSTAEIYSIIKEQFPEKLYSAWGDAVLEDYRSSSREESVETNEVAILKKYGTTAMFAISTEEALIFGKLDGNIAVIRNSDVSEPLLDGEDLMGSEAYSLCKRKDAFERWDFGICYDADLLTVSTDGWRNAFGEDDDPTFFHDAVNYVYNQLAENGAEETKKAMPPFLSRCSNEGSADDITICCFATKKEGGFTNV